jgi:hypothetical protein
LERVLLEKFTQYGLLIAHGYGGASYLPLKDIEVFGSASGSLVGIKVAAIGVYGGFILSIDGGSFSGGCTRPPQVVCTQLPIAVELQDSLVAKGIHIEQTTTGIYHYGSGGLSVDTMTGASPNGTSNVVNLIELGSTFAGVVNVRNLISNGITAPVVLIKNDKTGINVMGGSNGNLAQYVLDLQTTPAGTPNAVVY